MPWCFSAGARVLSTFSAPGSCGFRAGRSRLLPVLVCGRVNGSTPEQARPLRGMVQAVSECHPPAQRRRVHRTQTGAMACAEPRPAPPSPRPQLLSVAPMMDYTDVHYRQLARLISRHTWLYTEMVVDKTLVHNPHHDRFLWFPPEQHPIACQLGGSDPEALAFAAAAAARYGYDEINLNVGCPSDRVAGAGCFGAALMLQPARVAACCAAMAAAAPGVPITVKCRIGVDEATSYDALCRFVQSVVSAAPVRHVIVHARSCLLKGLSPHQNRTIPPLRYAWVWALARDFPGVSFSLNGGVPGLASVRAALDLDGERVRRIKGGSSEAASAAATIEPEELATEAEDLATEPGDASREAEDALALAQALARGSGPAALLGVMVGRAAYAAPWELLARADREVFGDASGDARTRRQVVEEYCQYTEELTRRWESPEAAQGAPDRGWMKPNLRMMFKPLLGLFHNEPKGRLWRAAVDGALKNATSVRQILQETLPMLPPEVLDRPAVSSEELLGEKVGIEGLDPARLAKLLPHLGDELPETPEWLAQLCMAAEAGKEARAVGE